MASVNRGEESQGASRRRGAAGGPQAGALLALAALIALVAVLARSGGGAMTERVNTGFAGAKASLKRAGTHDELIVSGMPPPPIGETYEVWVNRPGHVAQPTDALFTVARDGGASVEVPGRLRGVREVMVTAEPLGGSSHPTSTAVLRAVLANGG